MLDDARTKRRVTDAWNQAVEGKLPSTEITRTVLADEAKERCMQRGVEKHKKNDWPDKAPEQHYQKAMQHMKEGRALQWDDYVMLVDEQSGEHPAVNGKTRTDMLVEQILRRKEELLKQREEA